MEYKKGENGFILEFNETEEMNMERFIDTIKEHDEYKDLSSNTEFLTLILNEGVAAILQKTEGNNEAHNAMVNLGSFEFINDFLDAFLNGNAYVVKDDRLDNDNVLPFMAPQLGELLTLMTDFNPVVYEMDSEEKVDEYPIDESVPSVPNSHTEISTENKD